MAGVAAGLFADRGWGGTTLALVAAEAGVSVELVTKTFGNKAGLFMDAFVSTGLGNSGGLQEAYARLRLAEVAGVEARLDRFVGFVCGIVEPMGPLLFVLAQGAQQDPALHELERVAQLSHLMVCEDVVRLLSTGPPAPDAVDELYVLTRAETWLTLAQQRGWTIDRYAAWLRRSLRTAVDGLPVGG